MIHKVQFGVVGVDDGCASVCRLTAKLLELAASVGSNARRTKSQAKSYLSVGWMGARDSFCLFLYDQTRCMTNTTLYPPCSENMVKTNPRIKTPRIKVGVLYEKLLQQLA